MDAMGRGKGIVPLGEHNDALVRLAASVQTDKVVTVAGDDDTAIVVPVRQHGRVGNPLVGLARLEDAERIVPQLA
ncbi:hypothetical protein BH11ARM2_BH11ARM2_13580 [soil metagenome]